MAIVERLFFLSSPKDSPCLSSPIFQKNREKERADVTARIHAEGVEMTFVPRRAVVIDDAFGPPARGAVPSQDKDAWSDAVDGEGGVLASLRQAFPGNDSTEADAFIDALLGDSDYLRSLWFKYKKNELPDAKLDILFKTFELNSQARLDKATVVLETLRSSLGIANVDAFDDYDSAAAALETADIAFVDFFLANNNDPGVALERIAGAAGVLAKAKLLFFMSSRASLETQKQVRSKLDIRSAFFEVMQKTEITPEFVQAKIEAKVKAFLSNKALEGVINDSVDSTRRALTDFESRCKELEVHDLRLLDLSRLSVENESLPEYLTWLFSETLAAKTRQLARTKVLDRNIQPDSIGFTGQIGQGQILFDFFSEVVFASPRANNDGIRFGEVLRVAADPSKYLLVLTPACDLQRCSPTKMVLCTYANGEDYKSPKLLAQEKLFGKRGDGKLCHLYTDRTASQTTHYLLDWQCGEVETHTVQELQSDAYVRIAVMNELFAHEVKEESLRSLGRVGTQINPSPLHVLDATIRFWKGKTPVSEPVPKDRFQSAILTYMEQTERPKQAAAIIFSDDFKEWASATIQAHFPNAALETKLSNSLTTLKSSTEFRLTPPSFTKNENGLVVSIVARDKATGMGDKVSLEIVLWSE